MYLPEDKASSVKNDSGLDTDEFRIERSIHEMMAIAKDTDSNHKKKFLLNEIDYRQRQLAIIRKCNR